MADAQHAAQIVVATAHFVRVNVHSRAWLETHKGFLGLLVFHKLHADGAVAGDAAFQHVAVAVELGKGADKHVVGLRLVRVGHLAVTALQVCDLALNGGLVHFDFVAGELGTFAKLEAQLGRETHFVVEGEISGVVPVSSVLGLLAGDGVAEHVQLVFLNVVLKLLAEHLVQLLGQHGLAVLTTNELHGHFPFAEPRHLGLLLVTLQRAVNPWGVVV